MSDESVREFQLNGKQLVFLFMASTVVAVVIFLCGVMVGRGVSAAQSVAVANRTGRDRRSHRRSLFRTDPSGTFGAASRYCSQRLPATSQT